VVASDVGGIPEVVVDGGTGLLVHYDESAEAAFEADLAEAVNTLLRDPARTAAMGRAGRTRAVEEFSWGTIAAQTVDVYRSTLR
jgi:starch synthase